MAGDGDLVRPRGTELLGYEGEIAAVIGTRAHRVAPEDALAHVGWFAAANDAGIADFRWNDRGSNLFSKGQDGFTPIGPAVAAAEVDPQALVLRTRVNGEIVQEDVSANLIFSFADLIADLSRFITLEPGDVILTGTPTGTGVLDLGDVVEVELEGAGSVRSTVVEADHDIEAWGAGPKVTPEVRSWATGEPAPRAHELTPGAWEMLHHVGTATLTQQLQRRGCGTRGCAACAPRGRTSAWSATRGRCATSRCARTSATRTRPRSTRRRPPSRRSSRARRSSSRRARTRGRHDRRHPRRARARARGDRRGDRRRPARQPGRRRARHPDLLPGAARLRAGTLHYPLESMVPVTCGGVLVMPGDVMVGDAEGVVVVPAAMAEEVAHDATEQELREEWALERVQAGDSVRDTFPWRRSAVRSSRPGAPRARATEGDPMGFTVSDVKGAITPLVTPFHDDGSLDLASVGKLIDWQLERGTHAISVGGSTGEPTSQTVAERIEVMRTAVAAIDGRVPFLPGTGTARLDETFELTAEAQSLGAPPRSSSRRTTRARPSRACSTGTPDRDRVPGHADPRLQRADPVGGGHHAETVGRLRRAHENIVGIKETTRDFEHVSYVLDVCGTDFIALSGIELLCYPMLALGGDGHL